jgi:tetratricopeptide (TPR) repeat protein
MGAVSIYKSFPESDETRIARGYMKLLLLQHLQADFNSLTEYLYNDRYDQYDFTKRYAAEIKIKAALEITGRNHLLYNKLRAAELFLYTCNAFPEIQKGVSLSSRIQEQLQTGIDSLKNAVKLDPLAPFLHLQLGNFYLYTGQFEASIESYLTYTRLLPNDEYTYNRLGMAYYLSGNFTRASEMFKKSLRINPNFSDAAENLRISQKKAG